MRRGWHNDSYRHYLAAKGIKTSYYAKASKSPYSNVSISDINKANEYIMQVQAKNPKIMNAAEYVGRSEAQYNESHRQKILVKNRWRKYLSYIERFTDKDKLVATRDIFEKFGRDKRVLTALNQLEDANLIERDGECELRGILWKANYEEELPVKSYEELVKK